MNAMDNHRSDFWKGLATAILELGGVIGALTQSVLADRMEQSPTKRSTVLALVWSYRAH